MFLLLSHSESDLWVVAQWCNLLTLQSEQSVGVCLIPGRAPPLRCHDEALYSISASLLLRSQRLALKYATSPSPLGLNPHFCNDRRHSKETNKERIVGLI